MVALSAVCYLAIAVWAGFDQVVVAISRLGLAAILVALGLSMLNYLLRFLRWHRYLDVLDASIATGLNLRIYLAGFALTATPAKAGEMVRSVFLARYGVPYTKSLAAFFSDRFSDLIAILILTSLGIWSFPSARPAMLGLSLAVIVALLFVRSETLTSYLVTWAQRRAHPRLRPFLSSSTKLLNHVRSCFGRSTLFYGLALAVPAWAAQGLALYYIARLMGADIGLSAAVFTYSVAVLVGALSFIPGGIGATDFTIAGLLVLYGLPRPEAAACAIVVRVTSFWFAIFLGLLSLSRGKI